MSVIERADLPAEPPRRWPLLGEMLIEQGLVSEAQVDAALDRQRTRGKRLGECLVELGYLTRHVLYRELAHRDRRLTCRGLLRRSRRAAG